MADARLFQLGTLVAGAYQITLQAEDAASTVTLDNVNFEVENTDGTQRNIKITSAVAGDTTLTLSGNATIGDWLDQSVKAASSPTFAAITGNGVLTVKPDGTNEVFQVNDGSLDFSDGNAGTAGTLTVASDGDLTYNKNIYGGNAAGPAILNEAATTTNPTLCPNKAEEDTGIGWASDTLHLALGGATEYSFSTTVAQFNDNILQRPVIKDYGETVSVIGSDTTPECDLENGNCFTDTIDTGETTYTFSNPPASGTLGSFTLMITNGGSQTVNWPASVDWEGGTAPTLTTSGLDILVFWTIDAGTIWHGAVVSLDSK